MNKVGELIKAKRKEKGLSLRQLATKARISHSFVYDIEKGKMVGSTDTQEKLVKALGFDEKETEYFYELISKEKPLPTFVSEKIEDLEKKITKLEGGDSGEDTILNSYEMSDKEKGELKRILEMAVLMFNDEDFPEESREELAETLKKVFIRKLLNKKGKEGR